LRTTREDNKKETLNDALRTPLETTLEAILEGTLQDMSSKVISRGFLKVVPIRVSSRNVLQGVLQIDYYLLMLVQYMIYSSETIGKAAACRQSESIACAGNNVL
jgi:hypothetical protein